MAAKRKKKSAKKSAALPSGTVAAQKRQLANFAKRIGTLEGKVAMALAVLQDPADTCDMFRVRDAIKVLKG